MQELDTLRRRVAELELLEHQYRDVASALDQADRRWNDLLEVVGDSVFIIAMDQSILDANSHASRRLGYSHEELLTVPYAAIEVETNEGSSAWESDFSRTRVYEGTYLHKDGSRIPVEVSSRIIKYGGQAAILNFARSIAQRKQIQAEREQLITELDAYAHTVAHDLKGPVGIILGYGDVLLNVRELDEESLDHIAQRIVLSARTMQSIINELLMMASLRDTQHVPKHSLNMSEIVGRALDRLEIEIQSSGAVISLPDDWCTGIGYAAWIEEVWVNYISNAIKYGGAPPHLELGSTQEKDQVSFWIHDNGPGIAQEHHESLFKPFNRLDTTNPHGHGLGLSIVKSIIAKLGGEVGARSDPPEGSTFYFTLPGD